MSWDFFPDHELECHCGCGQQRMDRIFMFRLVGLRRELEMPMVLTSAYRCPAHDKAEGGKGEHPAGLAVDVAVRSSRFRYHLLRLAYEFNIPRIGEATSFIHLGADPTRDQFVKWAY